MSPVRVAGGKPHTASRPGWPAWRGGVRHTVKSHINRIFAKTGSADRAAAIRYARDHDLG